MTFSILLPGAIAGGLVRIIMTLMGKPTPPMLASMFKNNEIIETSSITSTSTTINNVDEKELGKGYGLSARVLKPSNQLSSFSSSTSTVTAVETLNSINSKNIKHLGRNYGLSARVPKPLTHQTQPRDTASELPITTPSTPNTPSINQGKGYGLSARVKIPPRITPVADITTTTPIVAPAPVIDVAASVVSSSVPSFVDTSLGKGYGFSARVEKPTNNNPTTAVAVNNRHGVVAVNSNKSYGLSARITKPIANSAISVTSELPINTTPSTTTPIASTTTITTNANDADRVPKQRKYGLSAGIKKAKLLAA